MPDTKITALAAITTVDPAADVLPIVDISDTSMAASGTTKKITSNQILGAGGTATLAAATITGDLTAARLIVTGGTIPTNGLWLPTTNTLEFAANSLAQYRIAPLGVFSWYDGAGGTRMTLNSTGLGVGVSSPSYKLDIAGTGNFQQLRVSNTNATSIGLVNTTSGLTYTLYSANTASNGFNGFGILDGSVYVFRINSNGALVLTGGNVAASGVGIAFPATQVLSSDPNTLDDYEEGTWTGTLTGSTTNPTTPVTATGRYTKIGRQVSIQIHFSNVDTTGASGQIKVSGSQIPSSNSSVGSTGAVMMSSIGSFTGSPVAFIGTSTTEIELYSSISAAGIGFVNHNPGASRSLWINLTYTV